MIDRVLRIGELLELDAETDLCELHRRDRAIGIEVAHLARPARRILAWSERREPHSARAGGGGEQGVLIALSAGGIVLGCLAVSGVVLYDGGGRVNVLAALGVLVGLQLVGLGFTVIGMVPDAWRGALPGLSTLHDVIARLAPGRLLARFGGGLVEPANRAAALLGAAGGRARLYRRFRKWLFLYASQVFAVSFNLGVLATFLAAVVFTDLAFGWSTTLDVEAASLSAIVDAFSVPWRSWAPQAVPSAALVEASRYFRLDPGPLADPAELGRWWSFIALSLFVYGLVPRLILLLVARWRRTVAFDWTVRHLPGAAELQYRLDHEVIETRGSVPQPSGTARDIPPGEPPPTAPGEAGPVIAWGDLGLAPGAALEISAAATGLPAGAVLCAGSAALDDDEAAVRAAAAASGPVTVLVKSWEPPLGDHLDFLGELRVGIGEGRTLIVVPVADPPMAPPAAGDVDVWRRVLARRADPWLSVRTVR